MIGAQPLCVETHFVVLFALGGPSGSRFNVFLPFSQGRGDPAAHHKSFLWLTQRSVLQMVAIFAQFNFALLGFHLDYLPQINLSWCDKIGGGVR